jgi:uncharacterized protein (TIGR00375 family)
MRIVADFHIHSKYSRATSRNMDLEGMSKGAKVKGLNLLGTGDFTYPGWFEELKEKLEPVDNSGLYKFNDIFWILTTEVSTIFNFKNMIKKIHHVIHVPSFDEAEQINESLSKYGRLEADGRPTLMMTAPELVEKIIGISNKAIITSSHIWTPWFGLFGSKSGFDSVEDCYQDQTKNIFSLETGLSSDPAMNWRLSSLDRFTLLSNSDPHSPNPWRLGREANVFELDRITYGEIYDAIKKKDKSKFLFTIETNPNYGKYHLDGHRNCGVSFTPEQARKLNNICPICGRKLTIGVLHRLEDLADREEGFIPKDAIPFKTLLPLYEIISFVTNTASLYSKKVLLEHDKLLEKFGTELNILLNIPREDLMKVTSEKIADGIIKVREEKVKYIGGYDGEYGRPVFDEKEYEKLKKQQEIKIHTQKSLKDFRKGP